MDTFRQMGFTMLESAEEGIKPGALFNKSAKGIITNLYASLTDLFIPQNLGVPTVIYDKKLSDKVSGFQNLDLTAESNVSFLKMLSQFFSKNIEAELKLTKEKKVQFDIDGLKKDVIGFAELDKFLGDARLDTSGKNTLQYLKDDDLFIITETIKSKLFRFRDAGNSGGSGSVQGGITNVVDANIGFDIKKGNEAVMENKNGVPLVIAVKAYQVFYEKSFFSGNKPPTFRLRLAEKITAARSEVEPYAILPDTTINLNLSK